MKEFVILHRVRYYPRMIKALAITALFCVCLSPVFAFGSTNTIVVATNSEPGSLLGIARSESNGPPVTLAWSVEKALQKNPGIVIERTRVENSRGQFQNTRGKFDVNVQSKVQRGKTHTPSIVKAQTENTLYVTKEDATSLQLNATKQLRSGISMGPVVEVNRKDDHVDTAVPNTDSSVSFQMTIPLLRGLGYSAVTAEERSAFAQLKSAQETLRHTVANQVLQTINAYWDCIGAEQSLQVNRESEDRALKLIDLTSALVSGSLQAASQVDQAQASYDQAVANRLSAEQNYLSAVQNYGLLIGLSEKEIASIAPPTEQLPEVPAPTNLNAAAIADLCKKALRERADLQAADYTIQSASALLDSARNGVLPEVNLGLSAGYAGVDDGDELATYYDSLSENMRGMNVQGSLSLNWPVQNNAAKGTLVSSRANVEYARGEKAKLAGEAVSSVVSDVAALRNAIAELEKRREAAKLYSKAVDDQQDLFRLGMGTLIDVITTQDKLASADLAELSAHLSVVKAIAQIHYDVGTLVKREDSNMFTVDTESIYNFPGSGESGSKAPSPDKQQANAGENANE